MKKLLMICAVGVIAGITVFTLSSVFGVFPISKTGNDSYSAPSMVSNVSPVVSNFPAVLITVNGHLYMHADSYGGCHHPSCEIY